jgi:hypothetical protein
MFRSLASLTSRLMLLSFLAVIAFSVWASGLQAAPIAYYSTQFSAVISGYEYIEDIKPLPPVEATTSLGFLLKASAPDTANFSANYGVYADWGGQGASVGAVYNFTATFLAIRIQYDYDLNAEAHGGISLAAASAGIASSLYDSTAGIYIWTDNQGVFATEQMSNTWIPSDSKTGTMDQILMLTFGNNYELTLSGFVSGVPGISGGSSASMQMQNIQIDAVPLPSALLLLGSGLLRLANYRRRKLASSS